MIPDLGSGRQRGVSNPVQIHSPESSTEQELSRVTIIISTSLGIVGWRRTTLSHTNFSPAPHLLNVAALLTCGQSTTTMTGASNSTRGDWRRTKGRWVMSGLSRKRLSRRAALRASGAVAAGAVVSQFPRVAHAHDLRPTPGRNTASARSSKSRIPERVSRLRAINGSRARIRL